MWVTAASAVLRRQSRAAPGNEWTSQLRVSC